jgi:hypothetical protein
LAVAIVEKDDAAGRKSLPRMGKARRASAAVDYDQIESQLGGQATQCWPHSHIRRPANSVATLEIRPLQ